jgi:glucose-6-phosphate isomerase
MPEKVLPRISFLDAPSHALVEAHSQRLRSIHLKHLYDSDVHRQEYLCKTFGELHLDLSKQKLDEAALKSLLGMAAECSLQEAIEAMFIGKAINETENRAVLHTALRRNTGNPLFVGAGDIMPEIKAELDRCYAFADAVISGEIRGKNGRKFTDVVNIGIGGSDLGPLMVCEALQPWNRGLRMHFVSNVDGSHLYYTLKELNPETTLFVVVSKTFSTQETMRNAESAKDWLSIHLGPDAIRTHFVAVSTRPDHAAQFGISRNRTFGFWDWVGGRYSLWSSAGLSICLSVGSAVFRELLEGAEAMDEHFRNSDFSSNLPVLLALAGLWNINYLGYSGLAVVPYDQLLRRFPSWLQQTDMESNGKSSDRSGRAISWHSGPIVWGEPGTNGQHAFFQWLHQGSTVLPVEFIVAANPANPWQEHHDMLLANCLAQSEALMNGKTAEAVRKEMAVKGFSDKEIEGILPFRLFAGDRPSTTLVIRKLNARNLGSLLALYEHKVFVQGVLWNIFSFDQWGVELGKEIADNLLPVLRGDDTPSGSSSHLISLVKRWKR